MRIVVREEIPEDPELRQAWNALALLTERAEVFYTHEWAVAVQRAYGGPRQPLLFLAYEKDSLVGLVAFATENSGSGDVVFLTASTADYCDFISGPGTRSEFVEATFSELQRRGLGRVVLTNLPSDSCTVAAISATAIKLRYNLHSRPAYACARVILGSAEQRSALKQATVHKKRLRRNFRELEKKGRVYIRHDTQWEEIEPNLRSFNRAHVARFLSTGRISSLLRAERRKFLYELARELSCSGWVTVSRLIVGEAAVAWNYGFRFAGSWFWYQPTVDSSNEYADYSPGYCLLAKIVELACESREIDVVDLGLGAEEYKDRFATASSRTLYCILNKSRSAHLWAVVRDWAAGVAKASPRVEGYLRSMISYIARAGESLRDRGLWGWLAWVARRSQSLLCASDEMLFFEWTDRNATANQSTTRLEPVNSDLLGAAAIHYADDAKTMGYLIKCAQRFRSGRGHGFAWVTSGNVPIHFCWVKDFGGCEMEELERKLRAPGGDAVVIFDCFTPNPVAASPDSFAEVASALADQLRAQGKVPWILAASSNPNCLRQIEKAGFTFRFSMRRNRILFVSRTKRLIPSLDAQGFVNSVEH